MKISSTILALPTDVDYSHVLLFDQIETTRQQLLKNKLSLYSTSMLSAIDMRYLKENLTLKDDFDILVDILSESIVLASKAGLSSISFGSPAIRQCKMSFNQLVRYFETVLNQAGIALDELSDTFTLFVEPLQNEYGTLDDYLEILRISDEVNDLLYYKNIRMLPMLDTGWWSRSKQPILQSERFKHIVANTTTRIHLSLEDTSFEFDQPFTKCESIKLFVEDILKINPNLELIYEHINRNNNRSYLKFYEWASNLKETLNEHKI